MNQKRAVEVQLSLNAFLKFWSKWFENVRVKSYAQLGSMTGMSKDVKYCEYKCKSFLELV